MPVATQIIRRLRWLFYLLLAFSGLCAFAVLLIFFTALKDLPRVPEPLSRIIETPPTEIFAATGERIMIIGGREFVPISRISPYFIRAVLATEDHRFWEHHGIDKLRTLKALAVTFFEPGKVEGASTITQQLAKNLFFTFERSYRRKFQELLVSFQIESRYNKREILEAYLNQIAFGVGAMGIERASRTFFGKPASDLALAEAAMLAGLPKSPARYNPYLHFERAKKRQRIVLLRMKAASYIEMAEVETAYQAGLNLKQRSAARAGGYFIDKIIKDLEERYGPEVVFHGGLKIMTTLDPRLQSIAQNALQNGLKRLDGILGSDKSSAGQRSRQPQRPQGAIVSVDANTGAVKALVGGRNYLESEFNRALHSNRLPGSGFKPFLYYAAFEKLGLNPAATLIDQAVRIHVRGAPNWVPQNFERSYAGKMVIKNALTQSVNTIAAQLVERTGPENVIEVARRCGINSPLQPVLSIALGTSGVSPFELASAFATFATGGIHHVPFFIRRIEDAQGRVLEEHIVSGKRVLDRRIAYQLVHMMQGVIDNGTGDVIRQLGFHLPAAGKTGTTDRFYDAWFTGFTPTLSTSVWVGFDQSRRMKDRWGVGITGGRGAAPIWAEFMIKATDGEPQREFNVPDDVRIESVDPYTGCRPERPDSTAVQVVLRNDQKLCEDISGNR